MAGLTPMEGLVQENAHLRVAFHRVKRCRTCGAEIVMVQSTKTLKWYPLDISPSTQYDRAGWRCSNTRFFHRCEQMQS